MFLPTGEAARWRVIYDRLKQMCIGDIITHEELFAMFPDASAKTVNGAFWQAVRHGVHAEMHRTFALVKGVGYRMVEAGEHLIFAAKKQRYALNDARRAAGQLAATDLGRVTADEARTIREQQDHLARRIEAESRALRRLTRTVELMNHRVMKTEVGLRDVVRDQTRVREALERHGIVVDQATAEDEVRS